MREYVVENEFIRAVHKAGGVAYKLNSLTANGLPDRLVLFFPGKTFFVELKAPGKQMRPLQVKRRKQLQGLGFPVFCIDRFSQIMPAIEAMKRWNPGDPFPDGIGAEVPELEEIALPDFLLDGEEGNDMSDFGDRFEPEDENALREFIDLDAVNDADAEGGIKHKEGRIGKKEKSKGY